MNWKKRRTRRFLSMRPWQATRQGKPRLRGKGPKSEFEFEPPDLAYSIRHIMERGSCERYRSDDLRDAMLEVDLPELMPKLFEIAEERGIETGLRPYEPTGPVVLDGEGHSTTDAVLMIEAPEYPPWPTGEAHLVDGKRQLPKVWTVQRSDGLWVELVTATPGGTRDPRSLELEPSQALALARALEAIAGHIETVR